MILSVRNISDKVLVQHIFQVLIPCVKWMWFCATSRGFQLSHWLMAHTSIHCLLVSCSYSVRNEGQVKNTSLKYVNEK